MFGKAASFVEVICFDRVDLVSEYDNFDFDFDRRCREPKSLLVVVAVKDERLVDFFLADCLLFLAIFSNVFKFSVVKRAGFEGPLALASMNLSGFRFQV